MFARSLAQRLLTVSAKRNIFASQLKRPLASKFFRFAIGAGTAFLVTRLAYTDGSSQKSTNFDAYLSHFPYTFKSMINKIDRQFIMRVRMLPQEDEAKLEAESSNGYYKEHNTKITDELALSCPPFAIRANYLNIFMGSNSTQVCGVDVDGQLFTLCFDVGVSNWNDTVIRSLLQQAINLRNNILISNAAGYGVPKGMRFLDLKNNSASEDAKETAEVAIAKMTKILAELNSPWRRFWRGDINAYVVSSTYGDKFKTKFLVPIAEKANNPENVYSFRVDYGGGRYSVAVFKGKTLVKETLLSGKYDDKAVKQYYCKDKENGIHNELLKNESAIYDACAKFVKENPNITQSNFNIDCEHTGFIRQEYFRQLAE
jgi:hypothetical protein